MINVSQVGLNVPNELLNASTLSEMIWQSRSDLSSLGSTLASHPGLSAPTLSSRVLALHSSTARPDLDYYVTCDT